MYSIQSVSLDDAQRVIQAGIAKANEIGSPSNIAVADAGGNLLAFARMQKAWLGSIDIAINKAFTSRAYRHEAAGRFHPARGGILWDPNVQPWSCNDLRRRPTVEER